MPVVLLASDTVRSANILPMIKLFTLFNLAGLLLFNLFFAGEVSIVQDLPARMDPGTEVRVTVTVNKAQTSGFAKLQIDLPAGLSATAIETRGASFTYADGKAKFIWMALPTQPSFKVSYTLRAGAGANGSFPVTARLSYIEDNERKTVDAAPSSILVGSSGIASAPTAAPQPAEQPAAQATMAANDLASATPASVIPDAAVSDAPQQPGQQGPGDVTASRVITPVNNGEVLVEVTVKKGLLRGFGKLQENLPAGFSAVAIQSDEAIFSVNGRIAKFVWLNLPAKSDLKVSYRLLAPAGADGNFTVNGEFGYLLNDITQRAVVGSTSFNLSAAATATTTETPATVPQQPKTAETAATTPKQTTTPATAHTPKQATTQAAAEPKHQAPAETAKVPAPKATSTPSPETGILFKVQITAAHREVGKPYFEQRHHYSGDFSIERHEGWIKYVTGRFDQYRAARDQRQAYIDAQYNFPGPFVTAYNNGDRITVQEALMIANQHRVP